MKTAELDLYTDYLLSTYGSATATGLSAMVQGDVSHDKVTRFLTEQAYTSKDLWQQVKTVVRSVQSDEGVLIFDDTIQEKAHTDESELMCWHYDHVSGRNVRGINLLNALYHSQGASIPVAFELVTKPIQYCDLRTRQVKRKSEVTKNEMMRQMIETCLHNALKFRFVLMDSWFSSEENFEFITAKGKHFIAALKDNRLIALSEEDRKAKRFVRVDEFIEALQAMNVTPHVAQNTSGRKSAVPEEIAQTVGYSISQMKRKIIEQGFGWAKLIGNIRQVMVRGIKRVDQMFVLTMTAYNLTRMRTLGEIRLQAV